MACADRETISPPWAVVNPHRTMKRNSDALTGATGFEASRSQRGANVTDENTHVTEAEPERIPKRFWWLKRIAIGVAALVIVVGVVRWWWGRCASRALDAELSRYVAAGQPILPSDFDPAPIPDKDNAALVLKEAAAALTLTTEQEEIVGELTSGPEPFGSRRDDARKIVEANAEAIGLVHKARSMPGADWGVRFRTLAVESNTRFLIEQDRLSNVLCVAARCHHEQGNHAAAFETLLDMLAAAERIEELPTMFAHCLDMAIVKHVAGCIEGLLPELRISDRPHVDGMPVRPADRLQIEAVIARLLDEEACRHGLVDGFYTERMMGLDTALMFIGGQVERSAVAGRPTARVVIRQQTGVFMSRPALELEIVRVMRYTAALPEAAKAPTWPACQKRLTPRPQVAWGPPAAGRLVSAFCVPVFANDVIRDHFRDLSYRRMAALGLAIRLYELDHGRRPERLDVLASQYLPDIPDDPFSGDGRKIGYKPSGETPMLYSVSLNGVDEHGAFGRDPNGLVDWEAKDLPFFLDGDRPIGTPTTKPARKTR